MASRRGSAAIRSHGPHERRRPKLIMARWKLRVTNNCLFVDEIESGGVALQHNARPGMRPYIHPLRGPDGRTCLTEDSPWHHPWQHGVQTGFHGVNGCDFWFDPGQQAKVVIGTIEPSAPRIVSESPPTWSIAARWRHADGSDLMAEKQTWSLQATADVLFLDMAWRIEAIPDVHIEQALYGGLFVRMPFRADLEASVISATGLEDDATEQQAAAWVDLRMPVNGGDVRGGMAILDHPQNPVTLLTGELTDSGGSIPHRASPGRSCWRQVKELVPAIV